MLLQNKCNNDEKYMQANIHPVSQSKLNRTSRDSSKATDEALHGRVPAATLELEVVVDKAHHIAHAGFLSEPLPIVDAENPHALMIVEVGQELRRDKEILSAVGLTCDFDQRVVHCALSALVHALVDLVDEGERSACFLSETHEVEYGGQRTFLEGVVSKHRGWTMN